MTLTVEYERENDGRWLAEVIELPGVLAEHREGPPEFMSISFAAA